MVAAVGVVGGVVEADGEKHEINGVDLVRERYPVSDDLSSWPVYSEINADITKHHAQC